MSGDAVVVPADAVPAPSVAGASASPGAEAAAAPGECVECGAVLRGQFCAECGQERVGADDLDFRRVVGDAAREATDLNGKLPRTLGALVARPGLLTVDFVAGRRRRWFGPVKLFLLTSVAYYVLAWAAYDAAGSRPDVRKIPGFGRVAAAKGMQPDALAAGLDRTLRRSTEATTNVLAAPALALGVAALFRGRRRRRYGEHLVFTLHYLALRNLLGMLQVAGIVLAGGPKHPLALTVWSALTFLPGPVWTWLALRRVYGAQGVTWRTGALVLIEVVALGAVGLLAVAIAVLLA